VKIEKKIALKYVEFSSKLNKFSSFNSIEDNGGLMHGSFAPPLQN